MNTGQNPAIRMMITMSHASRWVNPNSMIPQSSGFLHKNPNVKNLPVDLNLGVDEKLGYVANTAKNQNKRVVKYVEYYKSIPVQHSRITVEYNDETGDVARMDGRYLQNLGDEPGLSSEKIQMAKQNKNVCISTAENYIAKRYGQNNNMHSELLIVPEQNGVLEPFLAYKFFLQGDNLLAKYVMVNALTNKVFAEYEGRESAVAEYWSKTSMGGNPIYYYMYDGINYDALDVKIVADNQCTLDFPEYKVVNAEFRGTYSDVRALSPVMVQCARFGKMLRIVREAQCRITDFADKNNEACSPVSDLTFFLKNALQMFEEYTGKRFDKKIVSYAHFGNKYNNAFFTVNYGSGIDNYTHELYFGDGSYGIYPFSSSCVVTAHELAHARIFENSRLYYANETGSLNEAFADIVGVAFDEYLNKNKNKPTQDLKVGDDILAGYFVRDLCNPSVKTVTDFNNLPVGSNYLKSSHKGSGVFGFLACNLIANGTYDLKMLVKLFDTAQNYWSSIMTFSEIGCGLIQSARFLTFDENALRNELTAREIDTSSCP